jgi:hypothetical protein
LQGHLSGLSLPGCSNAWRHAAQDGYHKGIEVWLDGWWDLVPHTNAKQQVWDVPWEPWRPDKPIIHRRRQLS